MNNLPIGLQSISSWPWDVKDTHGIRNIHASDDRVIVLGSGDSEYYPITSATSNLTLTAKAPEIAILLFAVWNGIVRFEPSTNEIACRGIRYGVRIDEFGCPIPTKGLLEAIFIELGNAEKRNR